MTPAERTYDGVLVGGYAVWSEFIAQYYTLKYTEITVSLRIFVIPCDFGLLFNKHNLCVPFPLFFLLPVQ